MDLISVIVPVYNVEQYLARCVDSVRNQSYRNIEIILVDDGSPDRCPELCEEFRQQDLRVKVVHKENGGLGFARNSGLDAATGTYVVFIDSDDWISPDHVENLYREAVRVNADAVIGSHTKITSNGTVTPHPINVKQQVYEGAAVREEIVLPIIGADVSYPKDVQLEPSSCMILYRMHVITENNIRFPSEKVAISEDMFFNVAFFSNASRVSVIDEKGYYYFDNQASISRKYDTGRLKRTVRFYENMKCHLQKYGLEHDAAFRLERTFLMDIRVLLRMITLSDLSRREKYQEIKVVLDHALVQEVLNTYPLDTYVPAMRLLVKCMHRGNASGVYWLIMIREYAKGTTWLKVWLKRMSIG